MTPPVELQGLSGRYATALFTAASKKDSLKVVEEDLTRIKSAVTKNLQIQSYLNDPTLPREVKLKGVKQLFGKDKPSPLTTNLFSVLAENGRLNEWEKVIDGYLTLMTAQRGELDVTVTSAKALDAKAVSQVRSSLSKGKVGSEYKTINIVTKVNPALLGGLVIEFGDNTIDLSVSSKLSKLEKVLQESV